MIIHIYIMYIYIVVCVDVYDMLNSGIVLHNIFSGCHVMTNMCSMMFNDMEWRHVHRYAYVYVCLYVSIYILMW
jgi:hypothetical protein